MFSELISESSYIMRTILVDSQNFVDDDVVPVENIVRVFISHGEELEDFCSLGVGLDTVPLSVCPMLRRRPWNCN